MAPRIPTPSYSLTIRLRYPDTPGLLGRITSLVGNAGGDIGAIDIVDVRRDHITRDFTVDASDVEHGERIVATLDKVPDLEVVKVSDHTFLMHVGG